MAAFDQEKEVLVEFGERRHVMCISEKGSLDVQTLLKEVKNVFSIQSRGCSYCIQKFDQDWNEWVDATDASSLVDRDKAEGHNGTQCEATPEIVQSPEVDVFCICQQEEFGAMIACYNPQCPVQWFKFSCVGITREPTGHWYCDEWQLKVGQG
ncbi:Inhibitor of growth protein 2 [Acropora cervicornis]|uniref:Inhibitor of growth protein 2 n=1 Tax=Acropora cervicornis TaxID=6130 RepID=A0AAD9V9G8_ACRCE|nr:Inhibitor of growth protein 2 [Acropora cervicornis]